MIIDNSSFIECIEQIMQRFDRLEKILQGNPKPEILDGDEFLDTADLVKILKVTPRTLRKYRAAGILPFFMIKGRCYTRESDIQNLIAEKLQKK